MTKEEMFKNGLLKPGQEVHLFRVPDSNAVIVDKNNVSYKGEIMTFTKWAQSLTGWKAVNLYSKVALVNGERLCDLRKRSSSIRNDK
jgi:hypothetical protein